MSFLSKKKFVVEDFISAMAPRSGSNILKLPSFTLAFVFLSADNATAAAEAEVNGENPEEKKKLPYPKSVFLIIANEFCERFSFYGMRGGLSPQPVLLSLAFANC